MTEDNPRILFVDDFETVRLVFIKCLDELGINQVTQAENGEEALHIIRRAFLEGKPYDLVFADWNMPKLNGLELLKALRKDANFSQLPFVMVTANSDDTSVVEAARAGVSEYLIKPFETRSIARTIEKVLIRLRATG